MATSPNPFTYKIIWENGVPYARIMHQGFCWRLKYTYLRPILQHIEFSGKTFACECLIASETESMGDNTYRWARLRTPATSKMIVTVGTKTVSLRFADSVGHYEFAGDLGGFVRVIKSAYTTIKNRTSTGHQG